MSNRAARRRRGGATVSQPRKSVSGIGLADNLAQARRYADAEQVLRRVLMDKPRETRALVALAAAVGEQGRHDEAAAYAQKAIATEPTNARAHTLRGLALTELGRANSAIASLERALELGDNRWHVHNSLGTALHRLGEFERSITHLRTGAMIAPGVATVRSNLGVTLAAAGRFDEARREHKAALGIAPDDPQFRINFAVCELANGELSQGWEEYDRVLVAGFRGEHQYPEIPMWHGEPLAGRTILAYREQGLGDELIFGSCYPDLVAEARHVVIECRGRLVSLFTRSFPEATVRATRDESPLPPADLAVSAGSVARYRRRSLAEFPTTRGYLVPDPRQVRHWTRWRQSLPGRAIGVSWRSGLVTPTRRGAYPPLEDWRPVLTAGDATFVCLQYDDSTTDQGVIRERFGVELAIPPGLDPRNDIDGVAALIAALDVVVSVDNAVAAISGAVGAPTAVLVPAHSFTALGSDRWPWFPTVRTYERAPGDTWEPAMSALASTLSELADPTSSS
ncbi:MAG: tetratricopeptide repeat protein [Actinomycetota bacterium]